MADFSFLLDYGIIQTISILGALQGVVLGIVVLFYPRMHAVSNRILSLFLFSVALILIAPRLKSILDEHWMSLIYGVRFSPLMLLYFYIKSLYTSITWKKEWWNFGILGLHLGLSNAEVHWGSPGFELNNLYAITFFSIQLSTLILYFYILFRVLGKYRNKVEAHYSTHHRIGLVFSKQLVLWFLFISAYQLCMTLYYALTKNFSAGPILGLINTGLFMLYIYFIAIRGKLSPAIYQLRRLSERQATVPEPKPIEGTENDRHGLKNLAQRVTDELGQNKTYLDSQLTIQDLAEKLGVKTYLLSQAINLHLGKSFFELINTYRVEEAKKMLLDKNSEHLSLLGIGFESGFNSKTTFNTTFKRMTGFTPNEFKKQHLR